MIPTQIPKISISRETVYRVRMGTDVLTPPWKHKTQVKEDKNKKDELISHISGLPRDLKMKLYICSMRNFWKNYVPLTAQIPSWRSHHLAVQKELFDSRLQNIHFMHLSYNTLPENKTWIPGCQCEFCRSYQKANSGRTNRIYIQIASDIPGYSVVERDILPYHENGTYRYYVEDNENEQLIVRIINAPGLKENVDYDPLYDTEFQSSALYNLQKGIPLKFIRYEDISDSNSDSDSDSDSDS